MKVVIVKLASIFTLFLFIFVLFSCREGNKCQTGANKQNLTQKEINESLEKANRYLIMQEAEQIDNYVECNGLNVLQTGTGLRYQIHDSGDGVLIKEGDVVTLDYEVRLLNGDLLYSSKKDGYKTFLVGRGGVESGLEEAVLKLCKNSVATLIIPIHLAHGLIGDGNKIPPRSTLVYKLKVVDKY